jgi:hypothetical protein
LLAGIDPGAAGLGGLWMMDAGALSGQGPGAQIQLGAAPRGEYDYRVVFSRAIGEGPIGLIASEGGHSFAWIIGGHGNTVAGFGTVAGRDYDDNETTRQKNRWIENGMEHSALLRVRKDSVTAFLDGYPCCSMQTNFADMALPGTWHQTAESGLGVWLGGDNVRIASADVFEYSAPTTVPTTAPAATVP